MSWSWGEILFTSTACLPSARPKELLEVPWPKCPNRIQNRAETPSESAINQDSRLDRGTWGAITQSVITPRPRESWLEKTSLGTHSEILPADKLLSIFKLGTTSSYTELEIGRQLLLGQFFHIWGQQTSMNGQWRPATTSRRSNCKKWTKGISAW